MSLFTVIQRVLDKAGTSFIEPRREDGHGSAADNRTFVDTGLTQPTTPADTQPIEDSTDRPVTSIATSVTNAGDTVIFTPSAGNRVRLRWIYAINDPLATTSTKITVKMGAEVYYVAWAISKRQQFDGPVDGALTINLTNAGDVAVTAFVEEV